MAASDSRPPAGPHAPSLRTALKRHKWALVGYRILRNARAALRQAFGNRQSAGGRSHAGLAPDESVAYLERVYGDYLRYGGLSEDFVRDKDILEGGPGDNLGVALRFLAAGARRVVSMDRFDARHNPEQEREIYLRLRNRLAAGERKNFDQAVDLSRGIQFNRQRLEFVCGRGLERAADTFAASSFDMVVSRAVLEEIADGERVFAAIDRVLRPGGISLHKIDLSDYGLFSANGHHPLTFLTIPGPVYTLMARNSDRPGRKMADFYREQAERYGYDFRLYITAVIQRAYRRPGLEVLPHKIERDLIEGADYGGDTVALVREIRSRLRPPFRSLSDTDLMTAGIFLAARKKPG